MALSMERHLTKSSENAYNPDKDVSSPFRRLQFYVTPVGSESADGIAVTDFRKLITAVAVGGSSSERKLFPQLALDKVRAGITLKKHAPQ
ncbi:hypothetical protein [Rhizobium sp. X9]|uniref:hypothetical protein n=1 Tax=Rhizobium sp. X9 TaxID=2815360 RepID=UPI001C0B49BA|nr:hypothetical protein [Rhizobium sp. X9]